MLIHSFALLDHFLHTFLLLRDCLLECWDSSFQIKNRFRSLYPVSWRFLFQNLGRKFANVLMFLKFWPRSVNFAQACHVLSYFFLNIFKIVKYLIYCLPCCHSKNGRLFHFWFLFFVLLVNVEFEKTVVWHQRIAVGGVFDVIYNEFLRFQCFYGVIALCIFCFISNCIVNSLPVRSCIFKIYCFPAKVWPVVTAMVIYNFCQILFVFCK